MTGEIEGHQISLTSKPCLVSFVKSREVEIDEKGRNHPGVTGQLCVRQAAAGHHPQCGWPCGAQLRPQPAA